MATILFAQTAATTASEGLARHEFALRRRLGLKHRLKNLQRSRIVTAEVGDDAALGFEEVHFVGDLAFVGSVVAEELRAFLWRRWMRLKKGE